MTIFSYTLYQSDITRTHNIVSKLDLICPFFTKFSGVRMEHMQRVDVSLVWGYVFLAFGLKCKPVKWFNTGNPKRSLEFLKIYMWLISLHE